MDEKNFKADLHCHSTYSDGDQDPQSLLKLAQEKGLQGLSITDHDTVAAYLENDLFSSTTLQIIPGVEFTSTHRGVSVHVLAYSFSLKNPHILALSSVHKVRREERFRKMGALLQKEGFDIDIDKILSQVSMPGRPHLAWALFEKKYLKDPKDAFHSYIGDGKKCFVKSETLSTEETLSILKKAKAIAVIAHPHLIKENKILKDLLKMDFEGIEAYYGNFPKESCEKWLNIAEQKEWLITGGSDFHGEIKSPITLGASYTQEASFQTLKSRYEENILP